MPTLKNAVLPRISVGNTIQTIRRYYKSTEKFGTIQIFRRFFAKYLVLTIMYSQSHSLCRLCQYAPHGFRRPVVERLLLLGGDGSHALQPLLQLDGRQRDIAKMAAKT